MRNITTQNNHNQPVCTCPHCNSTSIIRSGFDRGTQRYRCKNCNKTFKATAGTPIHGLHKKEKILKYLKALRAGMSVRKAAEFVGISKNTSFAWRHKFLSSLETNTIVHSQDEVSTANIIKLKYSAKGRKKPPEMHTSSTRTIALLRNEQLELHKLSTVRQTHFATHVFSENSAYYFAAVPSKIITASIKHSDSAIKIKNSKTSKQLIANAKKHTAELLGWMDRFKGVASKYLQNYWNWYSTLFNLRQLKQEIEYFYKICVNSRSLHKYLITKQL